MILGETAKATDWEATPSLNIRETYDDHALATSQRSGDLVSILSPGISVALKEPTNETTLQYQISLLRYLRYHEFSTSPNHQLTLSHQTEWTERLKTSLSDALTSTADQTRFSQEGNRAQAGAILIPRTEVLQNTINYNVAYDTGPATHFDMSLFRGDTRYKNPALFDSTLHGVSLAHHRELSPESSRNLSYTFNHVSVDQERPAEIHSASVGYQNSLYPTFSVAVGGGSSYTTEDHRFRGIYDARLTKTFDHGMASVSAQRSMGVAQAVFASSFVNDTYALQGTWEFAEALQGSVQEAYNRNYSVGGLSERATSSTTTAALQYQLTAHWRGGVEYQYMNQRTEPVTIGTFHANRISIVLNWEGASRQ